MANKQQGKKKTSQANQYLWRETKIRYNWISLRYCLQNSSEIPSSIENILYKWKEFICWMNKMILQSRARRWYLLGDNWTHFLSPMQNEYRQITDGDGEKEENGGTECRQLDSNGWNDGKMKYIRNVSVRVRVKMTKMRVSSRSRSYIWTEKFTQVICCVGFGCVKLFPFFSLFAII